MEKEEETSILKMITLLLPEKSLLLIEELVREGWFESRSAAIRYMVFHFLQNWFKHQELLQSLLEAEGLKPRKRRMIKLR